MLRPRTDGLAREVLFTLTHEPHSFVPLDSNPKGASRGKDGPFLFKIESPLTHNQCGNNDALPP